MRSASRTKQRRLDLVELRPIGPGGRTMFRLIYGDNTGRVDLIVWEGRSYYAAILAAEDWVQRGVPLQDTVGDAE